MYMIKKVATILCLIPVICSATIGYVYAEAGYNKSKIQGTSQEISLELNKGVFTKAEEAILISEKLSTDAISATPLAYLKNAPIITTEWKHLSNEVIKYLKELEVKKVTIIGGLNLISKTTEKQLKDMGYEVERITGSGPYQRSRKIANIMSKSVDADKAFVVSSRASVANGLAIASYAAQNNIPIILSDDRYMHQTTNFLNAKGYEKVYGLGNYSRFIRYITDQVDAESKIIKEIDRQNMNTDMIENTYKHENIDTIYSIKADYDNFGKMGEYNSLGLVAAKQNIPILISLEDYSYSQEKFIENKNIKNMITVSEEVGEYKATNILKNKRFVSSVALIMLLILIVIRGLRS